MWIECGKNSCPKFLHCKAFVAPRKFSEFFSIFPSQVAWKKSLSEVSPWKTLRRSAEILILNISIFRRKLTIGVTKNLI